MFDKAWSIFIQYFNHVSLFFFFYNLTLASTYITFPSCEYLAYFVCNVPRSIWDTVILISSHGSQGFGSWDIEKTRVRR